MTRQRHERAGRGFRITPPEPVQRDPIEKSAQSIRFVRCIATCVVEPGTGEYLDGGTAHPVDCVAETLRSRAKRMIGESENAELHLRDDLQTTFVVQREELREHGLGEISTTEVE